MAMKIKTPKSCLTVSPNKPVTTAGGMVGNHTTKFC